MTRIQINGREYSYNGERWSAVAPDELNIEQILMLDELNRISPSAHQFTVDAVAERFPHMIVIEVEPENLEDTFESR